MLSDDAKIAIAREYYRRSDAGSPDLLDLFTEDAEIYFPKYGVGPARTAFAEAVAGLLTRLKSLVHPMTGYRYFPSGNALIVEGTTNGEALDGRTWTGGETPGGRFCSVLEFRGELISRMYIYLDPDYLSDNEEDFLWGRDGRRW
jgi:ketosteroid isomerase-like protein